jgi:hypothetical protein
MATAASRCGVHHLSLLMRDGAMLLVDYPSFPLRLDDLALPPYQVSSSATPSTSFVPTEA